MYVMREQQLMNKRRIEQGTIIYGIRSDKYAEVVNYAVVISARCDIANKKISKIYYLNAVNAREWFCTKCGFSKVYSDLIKNKKNAFSQEVSRYLINGDILLQFSREDVENIISNKETNERKRKSIFEKYYAVLELIDEEMTKSKRADIVSSNTKPVIEFLDKIMQGAMNHYFFIPMDAYKSNGIFDDGIIVDLQEISSLPIEDAEAIVSPGIDYKNLSQLKKEDVERYKKMYWLENEDEFVDIEATIKSPWCELLLQRFSNDFIRIGVDGANKSDYERLAKNIKGEE